jgi:glycosyltransferase involved in cell wall biosynthesis
MKVIQFTTDNREQQNDYDNPLPHFGTAPEALLEGFAALPDVEVHVVSCVRREVGIPDRIHGNIRYHPVLVPKTGWMSTLYSGCIRATSRLVREIAPDVVHGQGTERDCAMNAIYSGYPNVLTIHGNMAELNRLGDTFQGAPMYGFLASRLETHALRRTGGVFCNSAYTESLVAPRARQTWRVPNAIRADFFQPATGGSKRPIPTLVNVGVIGARKRQLELLRMVGEIVKSGRQMQVVFAGSLSENSEYGATFAAELRKAEAAGYAAFGGFLNLPELIRLLDSSHAFLHFPSEEAFGLVVAEAMARGLKFFGANLGGIVDIASGIDGAELHDDFESLKNGIVRWLDAGAPAPMLAADEIAKRYHPKVIAERHVEIYREVLGR